MVPVDDVVLTPSKSYGLVGLDSRNRSVGIVMTARRQKAKRMKAPNSRRALGLDAACIPYTPATARHSVTGRFKAKMTTNIVSSTSSRKAGVIITSILSRVLCWCTYSHEHKCLPLFQYKKVVLRCPTQCELLSNIHSL